MSFGVVDNTLAGVRTTNPAGNALYVSSINAAENNRGWKVYSIQPGGTLQFIDGLIDQVAGRLVFTPDGTTAFAAYCYFFFRISSNLPSPRMASSPTRSIKLIRQFLLASVPTLWRLRLREICWLQRGALPTPQVRAGTSSHCSTSIPGHRH